VFPNPVSAQAVISYSLPQSTSVTCVVYDVSGNLVSRLAGGTQAAGEHQLTWDTADAKPGIYFCKLVTGNSISTVRLARVR
jgi:flagellar hook assembly protein FlgD